MRLWLPSATDVVAKAKATARAQDLGCIFPVFLFDFIYGGKDVTIAVG